MLSSPTESLTNDAQTASVQTTRNLLLLLILFAGSGCSALIYEIVWYQLLQFSIGSTAVSLAILLATFMGGLCLGSLALPRIRALRRHHPLRVYAVMEAAIAFCAIVVLFEVPLVSHVYLGIAGHGLGAVLLRAFVCSICLLPPTALMGASLPAVSRWLESTREEFPGSVFYTEPTPPGRSSVAYWPGFTCCVFLTCAQPRSSRWPSTSPWR